ncbi:hypothetical protein OG292_27490 [Streptomyces sp. NBC_01511]|uniref:hypothetical protein n=1 Tax=Streptomyces sp. NBC_01511 TaxID=2903889 RepID=UPI00387080E0
MPTRRAFLVSTTAALSATALPAAATTATAAAPVRAAAPNGPVPAGPDSLGVPLTDVLLIGGTVAPGPDGRPACWNVSTGAPAHLNAIDPATGDVLVSAPLPGAQGAWATAAAPDGAVYVGSYGNGGRLYRWRGGDTVEDLGVPVPGETFVWRLAVDADGKVWGGGSPNGHLFRYDPDTGAVEDFGRPIADQTYVKSLACAGGKVYSGAYSQARIAEFDPATRTFTELPKPPGLPSADGQVVYDLDIHDGRLYARMGSAFPGPMFVYDLAARAWTDEIPDAHGLNISPPDADGGVYLIQKSELRRYDPATRQLTGTGLTFTGRVQNARSIGWAELGLPDYPGTSLVGTLWRGAMFRYNPRTGAYATLESKVRRDEPIEILALGAGGPGTVYAGGFLNGGLASVDTRTGKPEFHRFSQIESLLRGGDGSLWVGTYPEARLYRYEPGKTWSSPEYSPGPDGTPDNPERAYTLKDDVQMRAKALVEVRGKVVMGTVPDGDRLGGALAVYDPDSGELEVTRHVVRDESVFALATADGVVYGGCSITGGLGTTPPTRESGAVFAWHVRRKRKLWELVPVPGAGTVTAVAIGPDRKLWGIAGNTVFAISPHASPRISPPAPKVVRRFTVGAGRGGGDLAVLGRYLYASIDGNRIYRVDPWSRKPPVLVVEHAHRRLIAHPDGRLYFSSGAELYRVDPRDSVPGDQDD